MKIRKYLAKDMQEAIRLIKGDLGPEAVIISSKKVYGRGLLGLFQRQMEVTAALDDRGAVNETVEKKTPGPFKNIQEELSELKSMLNRVVRGQSGESTEDAFIGKWRAYLREMDLDERIVEELLDTVQEVADAGLNATKEVIEKALSQKVIDLLEPVYDSDSLSRVMSFVGPTGVGKTTTLAKMASHFKVYDQKEIALITIDTYRIGAVEQLKTYAEILDVPFEVVMTGREMEQALARHRDKDHVLIDTAGRSPTDGEKIAELRSLLKTAGSHDVYLVLSSNTRAKDLSRCMERFGGLKFNRFILTKLDETEVYGSLLNIAYGHSLPVSYTTNGQNVPDDIEKLRPRKIANLLFGGSVGSGGSSLEIEGINPQTGR